jgi:uncharacterized membrane protein YphA (DoxX/SURF4 family)
MTQVGITALRITLGAIFFMHGWQKFVQFTIPGTQAFFVDVGVPAAEVFAPVVAVLEIAGGVALVIGLFTRPFAVILAGISLGEVVLGLWVGPEGKVHAVPRLGFLPVGTPPGGFPINPTWRSQ